MEYLDFSIHVGLRAGKIYPVDAECLGAQYHGEIPATRLQADAFQQRLQQVADLQAKEETVRALGQELYELLFHDQTLAGLISSQAQARERHMGLRLKLRLDDPYIASLPWEFMADENGIPLATSPRTPLVRFIPLPIASSPLTITGPLHLLIMASKPKGLPPLAVAEELKRIEAALKPLRQRDLVEWTVAQEATRHQLQRLLLSGDCHVFHFIGHGEFEATAQPAEGRILLEGDDGQPDPVSAGDLAVLLHDSSVRLVVLNACQTATFDRQPFRAVGPALVAAQIPAVIAVQYSILDAASRAFSEMFYTALAQGLPVDAAVAEGRKGIITAVPGALDWGLPVLYMRAPDGVIFRREAVVAPEPQVEAPAMAGPVGPEGTPEEVRSLQERLAIHRRNLEELRRREALFGLEVPLWVSNSIRHEEEEIGKIVARLRELGVDSK